MKATLTLDGVRFRCASLRRYILVRPRTDGFGRPTVEILKRSDHLGTLKGTQRIYRPGTSIIDTETGDVV